MHLGQVTEWEEGQNVLYNIGQQAGVENCNETHTGYENVTEVTHRGKNTQETGVLPRTSWPRHTLDACLEGGQGRVACLEPPLTLRPGRVPFWGDRRDQSGEERQEGPHGRQTKMAAPEVAPAAGNGTRYPERAPLHWGWNTQVRLRLNHSNGTQKWAEHIGPSPTCPFLWPCQQTFGHNKDPKNAHPEAKKMQQKKEIVKKSPQKQTRKNRSGLTTFKKKGLFLSSQKKYTKPGPCCNL